MKSSMGKRFIIVMLYHAIALWGDNASNGNFFIRTTTPQPEDCQLDQWSQWTSCSPCQEKKYRYRKLLQPAKYEGRSCVGGLWDTMACQAATKCVPENNCGKDFQCQDSGRCIKRLLVCNGDLDCRDSSDEENCDDPEYEIFCKTLFPIPGAEKAVRGINILTQEDTQNVIDHRYFGGQCEYIYNGEWRELRYEPVCEQLYYSDDEKYFRKPYNFHIYQFLARAETRMSLEIYEDSNEVVNAVKRDSSFSFGMTFGVSVVESPVGVEVGLKYGLKTSHLKKITSFKQKNLQFVRLVTKIQTARFKMRRNLLTLDEDMLQALLELPDEYNYGLYAQFINDFGTHYITSGIMGGVMENVVVLDKEEMKRQEITASMVSHCFGASIGLSVNSDQSDLLPSAKLSGEICKKFEKQNEDNSSSSRTIKDVVTYVKGGDTGSAGGMLNVFDRRMYRYWGRSLKFNPAVIDFEAQPIYEGLQQTGISGIETKRQNLKRAYNEYLSEFDPCRCGPCHNNGIPILENNVCTCSCAAGFDGPSCENTLRTGVKADGRWSCWSPWSQCQAGKRQRTRECNNPAPKNGGAWCLGKNLQSEPC
ncbi:complement C8 alpha chain L homeolog precursor [Xenopus laevis]|uniref:Complement C8 alpha chain L homeolog precursor n=1 Tax=Xenopus laevis TaxID=8355 RepID=Q6GQ31_XENLA|nr:complement C8 alpha chain L homeolog precursor [Xenopus laevis]AAH72917.1 MGC80388 protein [Xenopus laevis]